MKDIDVKHRNTSHNEKGSMRDEKKFRKIKNIRSGRDIIFLFLFHECDIGMSKPPNNNSRHILLHIFLTNNIINL